MHNSATKRRFSLLAFFLEPGWNAGMAAKLDDLARAVFFDWNLEVPRETMPDAEGLAEGTGDDDVIRRALEGGLVGTELENRRRLRVRKKACRRRRLEENVGRREFGIRQTPRL